MDALRRAVLAVLAAIAAWPVAAQADRQDPRRRHLQDEQRLAPAPAVPQPGFGREESGDAGPGGRMSPEERRQLRRDIQDARRDLYPHRPRPDQEFRRF